MQSGAKITSFEKNIEIFQAEFNLFLFIFLIFPQFYYIWEDTK